MLAFALRRLLGMLLTLFGVSVITFLIYFVIPGGDPAVRIAGRTATHQNIFNIRAKLHLNDHLWTQWYYMMKSLFQGTLVSYTDQTNVVQQIKLGLPATFSLVIGAGIIPGGMEIMDRPAVAAAEAFVHADYPLDCEALMIVELDGCEAEVDHLIADLWHLVRNKIGQPNEIEPPKDAQKQFQPGQPALIFFALRGVTRMREAAVPAAGE